MYNKKKNFNPIKRQEAIKNYYKRLNENEEAVKPYVQKKVLDILSKSDRTRSELEEKIFKYINKDKHFDLVKKILDHYEELNFINDERFVENFIRIKHYNYFGENRIKSELKEKKINEDYMVEVIGKYNFYDSLKEYLENKINSGRLNNNINKKEHDKLIRKLISRGFDLNEIKNVLFDLDIKINYSNINKEKNKLTSVEKESFLNKMVKKNYGINKIKQEAKLKDINITDEDLLNFDFEEMVKKYLKSKYPDFKKMDFKERNKIKTHLLGRGFRFDDFKDIIK